jgi:hypothetical protein
LGNDHVLVFYLRQVVRLAIELDCVPPPLDITNKEKNLIFEALSCSADNPDSTWEHAQASRMLEGIKA